MAKSRNVFKRYKANIDTLIAVYPHLFNKLIPLPLALGIQDQIVNDGSTGLSRTMIGDCLNIWCKRVEYAASTRHKNAQRHNLNLTIAEPVSDEHKARAARVHDAKRHKAKIRNVWSKAAKRYKAKKAEGLRVEPLQVEDQNPDF